MKKLYTLSLLIASCVAFAQASDPFNYTAVVSSHGWYTHSGTAGQIATVTGSLTYPGLTPQGNKIEIIAGNTEDINIPSAAPLTGVVYYSALINLPDVTGQAANSTTGNYFLMLASTTGGSGVTIFGARLYVRAGVGTNTFNLGVLNGAGGTAAPTFSATDYAINTTYFVVVKYDMTNNIASLFVNPTIGGTEGTATVTNATGTTAAPAQIASLAIREAGTATAGTGDIFIDEVRMGATYASVTGSILKEEQFEIAGLKVYPNPVSNGVFYVATDANAERTVSVYDILGKQVINTTTSNTAVNVSNLNSGVYIVKITEEGKTATKKLIIK